MRASVVVATRERPERLERLLDALAAQTVDPREFEIVLVDDASRDRTPAVLRAAAERFTNLSVLERSEQGGPAGARNTGWRQACGDLIAFTDDDCEPAPTWLERLLAVAEANPAALIQGRTEPNPGENDRSGPYLRTIHVVALGPYYPTCNVAYPRDALERLGGFDEAFARGEDTDLAWRAIEDGVETVFAEDALVHHAVMDLGPVGKLRVALGWTPAVQALARHPGLRAGLHRGLFWKASHARLLLAVLGFVIARRFPLAVLLALPYAREVRARGRVERARARDLPFYAIHDGAETVAMAVGAVRYRVPVL